MIFTASPGDDPDVLAVMSSVCGVDTHNVDLSIREHVRSLIFFLLDEYKNWSQPYVIVFSHRISTQFNTSVRLSISSELHQHQKHHMREYISITFTYRSFRRGPGTCLFYTNECWNYSKCLVVVPTLYIVTISCFSSYLPLICWYFVNLQSLCLLALMVI